MRAHSLLVDEGEQEHAPARSFNIKKYAITSIVAAAIIVIAVIAIVFILAFEAYSPDTTYEKALRLMKITPLMDCHNDLPWQYRERVGNNVTALPIQNNLTDLGLQTDIPRIKAGRLGAQIWSVYIDCKDPDPIQATMEQIDVVYRMIEEYPTEFKQVLNHVEIMPTFKKGLVPSMIGMEGGHSINSSMGTLRAFYSLGARYMTLTHSCSTPWAQSANDNSGNVIGLTEYGKQIVLEMNRIGMMVDISHVAVQTMYDALNVSRAPVIFSHSNARALCDHIRNVPDEVLDLLPHNGGVVMVVFYPEFVCQKFAEEASRLSSQPGCDSACETEGLIAYQKTENACNYSHVVAHIDYIVKRIGIDHVGIGSDFDGAPVFPVGLEDVSKYPNIIVELLEKGYSDDDINKILSGNIIRVMKQAETVAKKLQKEKPVESNTVDLVVLYIMLFFFIIFYALLFYYFFVHQTPRAHTKEQ